MQLLIDTDMFNFSQIKHSKPDTGFMIGAHQSPIVDSQINISVYLGRKNKVNWLNVFKNLLGHSAVSAVPAPDNFDGEPELDEDGYYVHPPVGHNAILVDCEFPGEPTVDILAMRGETVYALVHGTRATNVEAFEIENTQFRPESEEERQIRVVRTRLRDAIRQAESELDGLYIELRKLEEEQENKDK